MEHYQVRFPTMGNRWVPFLFWSLKGRIARHFTPWKSSSRVQKAKRTHFLVWIPLKRNISLKIVPTRNPKTPSVFSGFFQDVITSMNPLRRTWRHVRIFQVGSDCPCEFHEGDSIAGMSPPKGIQSLIWISQHKPRVTMALHTSPAYSCLSCTRKGKYLVLF